MYIFFHSFTIPNAIVNIFNFESDENKRTHYRKILQAYEFD